MDQPGRRDRRHDGLTGNFTANKRLGYTTQKCDCNELKNLPAHVPAATEIG